MEKRIDPVFIGGCDRSGTTLLGSVLGSHHSILCVPEAQFKYELFVLASQNNKNIDIEKITDFLVRNWRLGLWGITEEIKNKFQKSGAEDIASILRWLSARYGQKIGKTKFSQWIDHTPSNLRHIFQLLDYFPDARFIHIVRDGRAIAASSSFSHLEWGPNTPLEAARFWLEKISYGLAAENTIGPERVIRIRYEDLLLQMNKTLERICDFLKIEVCDEMKKASGFTPHPYTARQHSLVGSPPDPKRAFAWKLSLTTREIEIFESVAGDVLRCLSYKPLFGECARPAKPWERRSMRLRSVILNIANRGRYLVRKIKARIK
jgi:hypothetical protein